MYIEIIIIIAGLFVFTNLFSWFIGWNEGFKDGHNIWTNEDKK